MIIPVEVEEKIRYLQNKFPSTEWSGVLFTTHLGSFESNDLTITCKDIFPMDLGNSAFTQFSMSEDVTAYIAEHVDTLWECDLNLVHSHHNMSTFFSGTDISTLQSEGNDTNCFVSLIVNNEGTYSAAVTRKVKLKSKTEYTGSYQFFGDGEQTLNNRSEEGEETIIEYFMLNIEKPVLPSKYQEIDKRFEEIKKSKERKEHDFTSTPNIVAVPSNDTSKKRESKFFQEEEITNTTFSLESIKETIAKMLLSSYVINLKRIDVHSWVEKNMVIAYRNNFGNADGSLFRNYAEAIIGVIMEYFDIDMNYDTATVANECIKELLSYSRNPYIQEYLDIFSLYLDLDQQNLNDTI